MVNVSKFCRAALLFCVAVGIQDCASTTRHEKEVPAATEKPGPSAASLLDKVGDRNDQGMSQIFLSTTTLGTKTTKTWCQGVAHNNEPVIKRELTKTGLCYRKICEKQKCEELGNPQIPKRASLQPKASLHKT